MKKAPSGAKNILYILVDDMRPELEAFGQNPNTHHAPHISALAKSGTVFTNAYCQISVCSPSRMSFLTSRRPDHSRIYNFINHFRQADCGLTEGGVVFSGKTSKEIKIGNCEWGGVSSTFCKQQNLWSDTSEPCIHPAFRKHHVAPVASAVVFALRILHALLGRTHMRIPLVSSRYSIFVCKTKIHLVLNEQIRLTTLPAC
jgi:hypothetical protein